MYLSSTHESLPLSIYKKKNMTTFWRGRIYPCQSNCLLQLGSYFWSFGHHSSPWLEHCAHRHSDDAKKKQKHKDKIKAKLLSKLSVVNICHMRLLPSSAISRHSGIRWAVRLVLLRVEGCVNPTASLWGRDSGMPTLSWLLKVSKNLQTVGWLLV